MKYKHIDNEGQFIAGPHEASSTYVNKLTRCGTPEVLDLLNMIFEDGSRLIEHIEPVPEPTDYTASNYAQLWQAAHDYEFSRISGSAIGMLTLGVLQGKLKCTAVAGWLKALWDDNYYPRKALVTSTQINPSQLDFSSLGEMPYTVPELTAEVYGA